MDNSENEQVEGFIDLSFLEPEQIEVEKEIEIQPTTTEQTINSEHSEAVTDDNLDATLLISIFDIVVSNSVAVGFNLFGKNVKAKDLQATATEINKLKPLVSKVCEKYATKMSIEVQLLIAVSFIYGSKIVIANETAEKIKPKKTEIKEKEVESSENLDSEKFFKSGKLKKKYQND